jgi:hypothetical protein
MTERLFVRAAAVVLTLGSAVALTMLGREGLNPAPAGVMLALTFLRALPVTAFFHIGLFWAPAAQGRQRVLVVVLMVPSLLLFGSLVAETIVRVARGAPLRPGFVALAITGFLLHAWQSVRVGGRVVASVREAASRRAADPAP